MGSESDYEHQLEASDGPIDDANLKAKAPSGPAEHER
jgi:hypothetical protein